MEEPISKGSDPGNRTEPASRSFGMDTSRGGITTPPATEGVSASTEANGRLSLGSADQQNDGSAARASAPANRKSLRAQPGRVRPSTEVRLHRSVFGPINLPVRPPPAGKGHGPGRIGSRLCTGVGWGFGPVPPVEPADPRVSSGENFGSTSRRLPDQGLCGPGSERQAVGDEGPSASPKRELRHSLRRWHDRSCGGQTPGNRKRPQMTTSSAKERLEEPDPPGEVPDQQQRIPERVEASAETPSGFPFFCAARRNPRSVR